MTMLHVEYGLNDLLFTSSGESYIDLISSTGAVFLGHANPNINQHIKKQLDKLSCSWTSQLAIHEECIESVTRHVNPDLKLYSLYSTGMEAAEVAMRMAFQKTGKTGLLGFKNNHHGKSVATINICRKEPGIPAMESFVEIPFLPDHPEHDILERVESTFRKEGIAAVFIEPIQGRGNGYAASREFYKALNALCHRYNVLVICDEIFTGFYRTGRCFYYPELDIQPDIVLTGKALGNGFPVSGVLLNNKFDYHPKDFRFNSTFSNNPLACAAVIGTLAEMERINIAGKVAAIESKLSAFAQFDQCQIRLYGAFCILHLESAKRTGCIYKHIFKNNILILQRENMLGFWPVATMTENHLDHVVAVTIEAFARHA